MTTVEQAQERAAKAATIKAVRGNIGTATVQLGRAVGKMTADPEQALADLDDAIGLLQTSREWFASITKPEA